ncbi:MAG: right-handed parallel beta-helix repeat-containing protein [Rikenellaceae bacterium]
MKRSILSLLTLILVFVVTIVPATLHAAGTVTVSSLEELVPYLSQSNVNVKLAPGIYIHTFKNAQSKTFRNSTIDVVEGKPSNAMLLVSGNNSTYDFEGVTIEVETAVFNAYKGNEFVELHIIGSDNVVKNLKLVDVGSKDDFPQNGCVNVIVDGARNLVEGIEIRSTGSKPYGYGEVFGKGGPATIRHKKHSACLVRGDYNHIKGCRIIHRAYGHFLFMQAAQNPTIEGCYIEGEMVTTDQILAEAGSGSAADNINFKTVWGYKVPKGYTLSTGEDGIRTYDAGTTIVDGERFKRGSSNITVKDCTVKHARGGVALTLSKGFKYVENCTLIGCQGGYATGSGGKIVNCRADAAFGAVFSTAYERDKDITVDITIMPYEGEAYVGNGPKQVAMIMGTGHNITFRRGEGLSEDQELRICLGGNRTGIGNLAEEQNLRAADLKIVNETKYPIIMGDKTTGIEGSTKGEIIDLGTSNNLKKE